MSRRAGNKAEQISSIERVPDDGLSVGLLIGRVRTVLLSALDAELEPLGLTAIQYGALKNIAHGTAETAADLCRILHYDNGSMTRMLDRLEQKGFIRRERGTEDRRVVYLRTTSAGRAVLPRLRASGVRVLDRLLAGFSPPEVEDLKRYLGRMIENGQPVHHE